MKGYNAAEGYMGLVNEKYMLFASESEYREYLEEMQKQKKANEYGRSVRKDTVWQICFFD